jgi:hypothetical protein
MPKKKLIGDFHYAFNQNQRNVLNVIDKTRHFQGIRLKHGMMFEISLQ